MFIAGNGPSLREVDFHSLESIDWLGMNAAYRYWDQINVYPTFYCCLDKVVVKEHASEIKRLLDTNKVKAAFLVKDVLEIEADLASYENVYFLEDLVTSDAEEAKIFKTPFSSKKTTGSWAIRFVIFLGYTEIFISGIDCNYVEIVTGAKHTGKDLELQIQDDSKSNPNYFFEGYQKKGDKYQVPNPESHFGNMHLQSLEAIAVDIVRNKFPVTIFNTAKSSNLYKYNVFPYMHVSRVFGNSGLDAVVIPMIRKEVSTLLSNFELWSDKGFQPISIPNVNFKKVYLHIVFDCENDDEVTHIVEDSFRRNAYLNTVFTGLRISFLSIPNHLNHYIRDLNDDSALRKSGPNIQALATFESLKEVYNTIYFMEVDNTPVQQGWLEKLSDFCLDNEFLIAGGVLNEIGNVDPALSLHINGNALYSIGDERFSSLLSDVFYPGMEYLICNKGNNHIAYDCLISALLSLTLSGRHRRDLGEPITAEITALTRKLQPYLKLITPVPGFVNIPPGTEGDVDRLLEYYLIKNTNALVVHNKAFNDELSSHRAALYSNADVDHPLFKSKFRNSHIGLLPSDQLAPFHYFNTRGGLVVEYVDYSRGILVIKGEKLDCQNKETLTKGLSIVLDSDMYSKGDKLIGYIELNAAENLDVELRLARHGEGEFCQAYKKVKARANGINTIQLPIKLKDHYNALRLVVSPHTSFSRMTIKFKVLCDNNRFEDTIPPTKFVLEKNAVANVVQTFDEIQASHKRKLCQQSEVMTNPKLAKLPGITEKRVSTSEGNNLNLPRVLVIDATLIGSGSATGQIKSLFFRNWPEEDVMQVYVHGQSLRATFPLSKEGNSKIFTEDYVIEKIDSFRPEVIYFRPTDDYKLFDVVDYALSKGCALITHMMDDWPTRLSKAEPVLAKELDIRLRHYFKIAHENFSICEKMSQEYNVRYGVNFVDLANGINIESIVPKNWNKRPAITKNAPIRILYMGGVADDMNYNSILRFASAVEKLSQSKPIKFEIYTMKWYQEKLRKDLQSLKATSVNDLVPKEEYYRCLTGADGLLIAYNFDDKTLDYVGLSFANKLPEVLASGVPGIFIGHRSIPTIECLGRLFPKSTLTKESALESDVIELINALYFNEPPLYLEMSRSGLYLAKEKFRDVERVAMFEKVMKRARSQAVDVAPATMIDMLKQANEALKSKKYREAFMLYCALNQLDIGRFSFWTSYCLRYLPKLRM
jgi:hypothetical protein